MDKNLLYLKIVVDPTNNQYVTIGLDFGKALSIGESSLVTFVSTTSGTQWKRVSSEIVIDIAVASNQLIGVGIINNKKGFYRWSSNIISSYSGIQDPRIIIKTYPTIASDRINIEATLPVYDQLNYSIYDINGKMIHSGVWITKVTWRSRIYLYFLSHPAVISLLLPLIKTRGQSHLNL